MFKLVVLSALLAVAAARPGFLHAAPLVHHEVVAAVPAATSYSSRVDVHSKPVVAVHEVHAAPVAVHAAPVAVHAAPVAVHAAPVAVAHSVHSVPTAVSHQSRVDVHHTAYAVPAVHHVAAVHAAPVVHHEVHAPVVAAHALHHW